MRKYFLARKSRPEGNERKAEVISGILDEELWGRPDSLVIRDCGIHGRRFCHKVKLAHQLGP